MANHSLREKEALGRRMSDSTFTGSNHWLARVLIAPSSENCSRSKRKGLVFLPRALNCSILSLKVAP